MWNVSDCWRESGGGVGHFIRIIDSSTMFSLFKQRRPGFNHLDGFPHIRKKGGRNIAQYSLDSYGSTFATPPPYIALHSITIDLYCTIITYIALAAHDIAPHSILVWKSCRCT